MSAVASSGHIVFPKAVNSSALGYPSRHLKLVAIKNLPMITDLQPPDDPADPVFFVPVKRIARVRGRLNRRFLHIFNANGIVEVSEGVEFVMAHAEPAGKFMSHLLDSFDLALTTNQKASRRKRIRKE
jgi:hypothetical protein